jgi:DNA invertase Pin-like site-specific DNA recombinase
MKLIAYYRVSSKQQGRSGLGLDAQRKMVTDYVVANGAELAAEYTEVESGKIDDRPELQAAIKHAALVGGTLIVGKLDRISRDLHFITSLQKNKTEFIVCDMPNCDAFTIHIYGALAQRERELISSRTKAALAVKREWYAEHEEELKQEGKRYRLGNNNLDADKLREYSSAGNAVIKYNADAYAANVKPTIAGLQAQGLSLRGVAEELNRLGVTTPRGKQWTATAVKNAMAR